MKDFQKAVEDGILGLNKGLVTGYNRLDSFTSNLQMESYEVIGGGAKTGKTAFIDDRYVLKSHILNPDEDIKWIYMSYEISRLRKTAKWVAWFLYHYYGKLVSPDVILSKGKYANQSFRNNYNKKLIFEILEKYVEPLLGKYSSTGRLEKQGNIDFHDIPNNPTGIYKYIKHYFDNIGEYKKGWAYTEEDGVKKRIEVQNFELKPYYKKRKTIIIIDHLALVRKERGFNQKETIDKLSEYMVEIRNTFKPLIVVTSQFNRDMSKIDRLKFAGNELKPTKEDFKDSGNPAQDCNKLYGLFNPSLYPHIEKYLEINGKSYDIKQIQKRSLAVHLLESRDTEGHVDLMCINFGECGYIQELPRQDLMTNIIYNKLKSNQKLN